MLGTEILLFFFFFFKGLAAKVLRMHITLWWPFTYSTNFWSLQYQFSVYPPKRYIRVILAEDIFKLTLTNPQNVRSDSVIPGHMGFQLPVIDNV